MSLSTKIRIAVLLVVLAAFAALMIQHERDKASVLSASQAAADQKARADQLDKANQANLSTIDTLRQDAAEKDRLAKEADARATAIQAKYDGLSQTYQELKHADAPTRDWAATALPAGVASVFNRALAAPGDRDADGVPSAAGHQ